MGAEKRLTFLNMMNNQRPFRNSILWGILFVALLCGNGSADGFASDFSTNLGPGVLLFSSASFGQSLRYTPIPLVPEQIVPGRIETRISASWVNFFGKIGRERKVYILDCEMMQNQLSVSYGVDRRLLLGLTITHRKYFGGAMDSFIHGFHETFGLKNNGRESKEKDAFEIVLCDLEFNVVENIDNRKTIENNRVDFFASRIISQGTTTLPAINLFSTLSCGFDTPFVKESEQVDFNLGIGASKKWTSNLYSCHAISYTFFGGTETEHFFMADSALYIFNSIAWQLNPSFSLMLHYSYSEGIFKNLRVLNESTHELYAGIKWHTTQRGMLEFALSENLFNYGNSPDFGIHCAYTFAL
jgi:hypothetical protein